MSSPTSIFLVMKKLRSKFDTKKSNWVGNDQDAKLIKVDGSYRRTPKFPQFRGSSQNSVWVGFWFWSQYFKPVFRVIVCFPRTAIDNAFF